MKKLFVIFIFSLSGCAGQVESPKFYWHIPNTEYSAYGYAGVGISKDSGDEALRK